MYENITKHRGADMYRYNQNDTQSQSRNNRRAQNEQTYDEWDSPLQEYDDYQSDNRRDNRAQQYERAQPYDYRDTQRQNYGRTQPYDNRDYQPRNNYGSPQPYGYRDTQRQDYGSTQPYDYGSTQRQDYSSTQPYDYGNTQQQGIADFIGNFVELVWTDRRLKTFAIALFVVSLLMLMAGNAETDSTYEYVHPDYSRTSYTSYTDSFSIAEEYSKLKDELGAVVDDITSWTDSSILTASGSDVEPTHAELIDGMRPEFKEAMDSYEAYFDEYIVLMDKLEKDAGNLKLMLEYAKFMASYEDTMKKFEAWEDEDMNDAESLYYIKVQNRINEKLYAASLD